MLGNKLAYCVGLSDWTESSVAPIFPERAVLFLCTVRHFLVAKKVADRQIDFHTNEPKLVEWFGRLPTENCCEGIFLRAKSSKNP